MSDYEYNHAISLISQQSLLSRKLDLFSLNLKNTTRLIGIYKSFHSKTFHMKFHYQPFLLLALLLCIGLNTNAQAYTDGWLARLGGDAYRPSNWTYLDPDDRPSDIAVDKYGMTYVVGMIKDAPNVTFNQKKYTTFDDYDGFIAKLDAEGNFLWAHIIGGSAYEDDIMAVEIDNDNEWVYIAGKCKL